MNLIAIYTVLLVAGVLFGSRLDKLVRLTHTRTQLLMSLISGLLLGIAIFHLLPHAVYSSDVSIDVLARYLMLGLLTMFFLQRVFHFHHHEYDSKDAAPTDLGRAGLGVIIGLSIHSFMDGIALAFSIQADWMIEGNGAGFGGLAAFGVFLAILLHKPLDALTLNLFLRDRGVSQSRQVMVLVAYALICPVVVALIIFAGQSLVPSPSLISAVLAFSAGLFLCIALSDLLPEIHFHSHDRGKMAVMLLLGVLLSLAIGMVESDHRHEEVHFKGIEHLDHLHKDDRLNDHQHAHD